jgi:hypothetical protein
MHDHANHKQRGQRSMIQNILQRKLVITIAAVVIVGASALLVYRYNATHNLDDVTTVEKLVGRHYVLPDETPALATVTDKSKLNTDFLKSAQNGDKILIYQKAQKAFIYRPSIDKLIEVGPISIAPAGTN